MQATNKWSVKDVITTVLLSLLMAVVQFGVNMLGMVNNFVSMVLSVGIGCFLCGPIYFLLVRRVKKRFVSAVYMLIVSMIFLLLGDWFVSLYFIVPVFMMEVILWNNEKREHTGRIRAAWLVYSACYIGANLLPLWFLWDTYESTALASGASQEYLSSFVQYYTSPLWLGIILCVNVGCGLLGSALGNKLTNRHFKKAGVL